MAVWDPETSLWLGSTSHPHSAEIRAMCFYDDGAVLASVDACGSVFLWQVSDSAVPAIPFRTLHLLIYRDFDPSPPSLQTPHLGFSPDGSKPLCSSQKNEVLIWSVHDGGLLGVIASEGIFLAMHVSSDESGITTCYANESSILIQLRCFQTYQPINQPFFVNLPGGRRIRSPRSSFARFSKGGDWFTMSSFEGQNIHPVQTCIHLPTEKVSFRQTFGPKPPADVHNVALYLSTDGRKVASSDAYG